MGCGAPFHCKKCRRKTWNFVWFGIDSSLQTNDSKWLESSHGSTLTLTRPSHDSDLTQKNFRRLLPDSDSKGLWLRHNKNDSDTSLQVLHFGCSLFYPIFSHHLTTFVHFYVGFTLLIVLLYFIISQRFSFYTFAIFLWHTISNSYNVMVSYASLSLYAIVLTVSCYCKAVCYTWLKNIALTKPTWIGGRNVG